MPSAVEERLRSKYDVTVASVAPDRETLRAAMTQYDALCSSIRDCIDAGLLATAGITTKIIANFGVGIEHIDLAAARRAGVLVTNTPDALTQATAELTILLMLMASRRAGEGERIVRSGRWGGWQPTDLLGRGLPGKTLGLVGFGRIARETAKCAHRAFGMSIEYYARHRVAEADEAPSVAKYHSTLESLLQAADIVSLHVPGGEATRHLIDARRIALMKPSAIVVNTARGSIVDEVALADALAQRRIAAAALDVYEREPQVHPQLMELENVVLLPHLGSATVETRTAMGMQMANNVDCFFAGQPPPNAVT